MSRTGTADAAVGMMDAAYFTGRKELLEFFNDLLALNLQKIEQTCTGAVACQIAELIFPGSVPMSRINWEAKSDYEYVQNYKLLQAAFTKNRVQRHVDVDKLIRGKYQDNLEFCQWLKAFYDQSGVYREDYDPMAARAKGKGGKRFNTLLEKTAKYGSKPPPQSRPRPRPAGSSSTSTARSTGASMGAAATTSTARPKPTTAASRPARPLRERAPANATSNQKSEMAAQAVVADANLMKKNGELTNTVTDLEVKVTDLEQAVVDIESERDYYFEKLRNVEVMLQVHQEKGAESDTDAMVEKIFRILYATAEDGLVVNDEGEVVTVDELLAEGEGEENGGTIEGESFEEAEEVIEA